MRSVKRAICILLILCFAGAASACRAAVLPDCGVWRCEELNITASFEDSVPSTCMIDGKLTEVECGVFDHGRQFDLYTKGFDYDVVFTGSCERAEKDRMVITDMSDRTEHVFVRMDTDGQTN